MNTELAEKTCVPCQGGVPPLTNRQIKELQQQLHHDWQVVDDHHLLRTYSFPDFAEGLAFVNKIGQLAEEQGHHPDIYLAYGEVRIEVWTHKIDGLTESDFVFAAKCDAL